MPLKIGAPDVTVHAYTPRAIQTALRAGVVCIDHAQLIDDATAKMVFADRGAWLSLQPFTDEGKVLMRKDLQTVLNNKR